MAAVPEHVTILISDLQNLDTEHGITLAGSNANEEDLIYEVPSVMANQRHKHEKDGLLNVFSPAIVSIGPLHFNTSFSMGNQVKKEALRKMMEEHRPVKSSMLADLAQQIERQEEAIKQCYADHTKIPKYLKGSNFAWMMLLDACFVMQALLMFAHKSFKDLNAEVWPHLAMFKDYHLKHVLIQDLLKLENQIPFFVLRLVAEAFGELQAFEDVVTKALLKMSPLKSHPLYLSKGVVLRFESPKPHLLSLLRSFLCSQCSIQMDQGEPMAVAEAEAEEAEPEPKSLFGASCAMQNLMEIAPSMKDVRRFSLRALLRCLGFVTMVLLWVPMLLVGLIVVVPLYLSMLIFVVLLLIIATFWPRNEEPAGAMLRAENLANRVSFQFYFGDISDIQVTSIEDFVSSFEPLKRVLSQFQMSSNGINERVGITRKVMHMFSSVRLRMQMSSIRIQQALSRTQLQRNQSGYTSALFHMIAVILGPSTVPRNSTLALPQMKMNHSSTLILYNLIALERCSVRLLNKTVCNYVLLMSKLLQTPAGVERLEMEQVIKTRRLRDKDTEWTVRMWQGLHCSVSELQSWDSEDSCIKTLRKLRQLPKPKRSVILLKSLAFWWKDLDRRYGSNPWVALSTTAALLLLIMTAMQVVCLFATCNAKHG